MSIQAASNGDEANPGHSNQYAASARKPLLIFILFTLALTALGYSVFQHHKRGIKSDKQHELSGFAELKIGQITNWIAERKNDARALKDDPLFIAEVDRWLQRGGKSGETSVKLTERLASLQRSYAAYGYTSVSLLDTPSTPAAR